MELLKMEAASLLESMLKNNNRYSLALKPGGKKQKGAKAAVERQM